MMLWYVTWEKTHNDHQPSDRQAKKEPCANSQVMRSPCSMVNNYIPVLSYIYNPPVNQAFSASSTLFHEPSGKLKQLSKITMLYRKTLYFSISSVMLNSYVTVMSSAYSSPKKKRLPGTGTPSLSPGRPAPGPGRTGRSCGWTRRSRTGRSGAP